MKLLVTGASGFIGRHIITRLAENKNITVYGMVRPGAQNINEAAKYVVADLAEKELVEKISFSCGSLDVIIHVAACLSKNNQDFQLIRSNCYGMLNIIQMAHQLQCKRFVYISSIPVIGKPALRPITEEHFTAPETTYHATKLFGEHLLMLRENKAFNPIILRLSSPVGKGMNQQTILPVFLDRCSAGQNIVLYGKGTRRQNYIDIRDICTAIELAIQSEVCGVYNIASRQITSNLELAEMCIKLGNFNVTIEFSGKDDPEEGDDWDISIEKTIRDLQFKPKYSICDTIQSLLEIE